MSLISNGKISTNRLLDESLFLNSKVEKYQKMLNITSSMMEEYEKRNIKKKSKRHLSKHLSTSNIFTEVQNKNPKDIYEEKTSYLHNNFKSSLNKINHTDINENGANNINNNNLILNDNLPFKSENQLSGLLEQISDLKIENSNKISEIAQLKKMIMLNEEEINNKNKENENLMIKIKELKNNNRLNDNNYILFEELNNLNKENKKLTEEYESFKTYTINKLEIEYKNKIARFEENQKLELEFLTQNLKNTIIKEQNNSTVLKNKISALEKEKNLLLLQNKNNLNEINDKQNSINILNNKISELNDIISTIGKEKNFVSENNNNLLSQTSNLHEYEIKNLTNELLLQSEKNNNESLQQKIDFLQKEIAISKNENNNLFKTLNFYNKKIQNIFSEITNLKKYLNNIKNESKNNYQSLIFQNNDIKVIIEHKILNFIETNDLTFKNQKNQYEKIINDQRKLISKITKENSNLIQEVNELKLQIKNLLFEIESYKSEIDNYKIQIKKKNNELSEIIKNNDIIKNNRNILIKQFSEKINMLLLKINKLKKKYQSEIFSLKLNLKNFKKNLINDISVNNLIRYRKKNEIIINENNKLRILIERLQNKYNCVLNENKNINENINLLNKEIIIKEKNINDFKNVFGESIKSFSDSLKNIKIAHKLDGDVKQLIENN